MIDWQRVGELRDEVGAEDFGEVVALFLEEVEEVVDTLRTAPDPARYEQDLHLLKGSALNIGFAEFAAHCAAGERSAAAGRPDEVDVAAVIASFDATKRAFLGGLKTDAAA